MLQAAGNVGRGEPVPVPASGAPGTAREMNETAPVIPAALRPLKGIPFRTGDGAFRENHVSGFPMAGLNRKGLRCCS